MMTCARDTPNGAPRNTRTKSCKPQKYFTGLFSSEIETVSPQFSMCTKGHLFVEKAPDGAKGRACLSLPHGVNRPENRSILCF